MKLLHECLVRSAREYPGNIAVVDQAGSCSYAELDARAEAYAGLLVALGVGRGERILLWAEKSVELPALMQGALRQGVVYVPVDPLGPVSRLEKILADSGASLVFSTASRLADLDALERRPRIVALDDPACPLHWSHVELPASASAPEEIGEHDLAYILYTSGSTGTPKGVALSHRNALAFVEWANERFAFEARDRFSNHAPFHFDLSVLDLYCAFSRGAAVCLVPEGIAFSPALLTAFLQEQRISVWYSVPSVLLMMMRDGNLLQSCPDSLRVVLFAGEPFPIKHLRVLREAFPGLRMANLFGPTETNVCTCYEVVAVDPARLQPVPIGTAASGDEVWAEKDDGRRCEVGEEGELIVRGPTVMLGYFGQPAVTGSYRTGDLVRQLDDGNYEYLGRRDDMLKVRGYRIERGEVEAALLAHPRVREAAVIVAGGGMDAALWAFLVPSDGEAVSLIELKRHCAERLPRYMIVDRAKTLAELPRNANGKVDRFKLKALVED